LPIACSGSVSVDGGQQQCGCQEQSADGHTYAVNCDSSTATCSCVIDNGAPSHTVPSNNTTCSDPIALFAACGFPAQ
jgi:hypothetical protein